jgi:hypothetical protein
MAVGDHYRPTDGELAAGIYRVVGTTDGVTLLLVGTADGRRVHPGTVYRVEPATLEAAFEPAPNLDAGLTPVRAVRNALQGLYWSLRRLVP